MKQRIKRFFLVLYYLPIAALVYPKYRAYDEMQRWYEVLRIPMPRRRFWQFITLFDMLLEFRTLVYYRTHVSKYNPLTKLYAGQAGLYIHGIDKIGEGLVIQHGHSCQILPKSIGENCQIWQNVTIGKKYSGGPLPTIGSNCKICANSLILGGGYVLAIM